MNQLISGLLDGATHNVRKSCQSGWTYICGFHIPGEVKKCDFIVSENCLLKV